MRNRLSATTMAAVIAFGMLGPAWTSLANAQYYGTGNDRQYDSRYDRQSDSRTGSRYGDRNARYSRYDRMTLRAGAPIEVRLDSKISTEDATEGQNWTGSIARDVMSGGRVVMPEGARVEGVVTLSEQGTHNTRPQLGLAVREVGVNGNWYRLNAETETIVGDSKRAKKIGAVVGGAAVGGLLGHAIGGDKGGLLGGLLGGAGGYAATRHALRTLQLKPGTVVTFTTTQDMTANR